MAQFKRNTLEQAGLLREGHHVVALNALVDEGPQSLASIARELLDPAEGTAVVTEGLLNYFPQRDVDGIWRRIADLLRSTEPGGLYLSDLSLNRDVHRSVTAQAFRAALTVFSRGAVHTPLQTPEEARQALLSAGFTDARLFTPPQMAHTVPIPAPMGAIRVRILHAQAHRPH